MYTRILFAMLVMIGTTAFAPAPFPREERKLRVSENDLVKMQGTWKVTGYERPGIKGAGAMKYSVNMSIRITPGKWEYVYDNNNNLGRGLAVNNNEYEMKVETASNPRKMTMTKDYGAGTTMTMNAIYKFEGEKLKVMYTSTYQGRGFAQQVQQTVTTWENPPTNAILMTLERVK